MANIRELTEKIAEVTGIEPVTMARYARFAREGGYISQSGRGTSAARMTPLDAANLLACALSNDIAQDAPRHIKRIMCMDVFYSDSDELEERPAQRKNALRRILPVIFDRRHTLHQLLHSLVEIAARNPDDFRERFRNSSISFTCYEYEALVFFNINLSPTLSILEHAESFQFSYSKRSSRSVSDHFRRSTQLEFTGIALVSELLAAK